MVELRIVEDPPYELWNAVLNSSTEGNYQQTIEYGEVMKKSYPRTRSMRLLAIEKERPLGIIQGTYRKRFGFGGCVVVGGVGGGAPFTAVKDEGKKILVTRKLLMALESYAIRSRIIESRIYWPESWGMHNIFHDLNYSCTREINVITIDLNKSIDDLWKSMKSNKRKNVNKARSRGVEVVEGRDKEDLLSFYRMVQESGKRAGFKPPPLSEFEAYWELFRPKNMARTFLAKLENKDVAGVFVIIHGDTLYARAAGSLTEAWSVRPNDILHWEVMEWACKNGFSKYNLSAVSEPIPEPSSPQYGLWRWKKEFRGRLEKFHNFTKVYCPKTKNVFGKVYGLGKKMQRLKIFL